MELSKKGHTWNPTFVLYREVVLLEVISYRVYIQDCPLLRALLECPLSEVLPYWFHCV